jgi:putative chitinase
MTITPDLLVDGVECAPAVADQWADHLQTACDEFGITHPLAVVYFLANLGHESDSLTRLRENTNYSAQGLADTWKARYAVDATAARPRQPNSLALRLHRDPRAIAANVYANRMGNGDEASGDGWTYRGAGPLQHTGADEMRTVTANLRARLGSHVPDFLAHPDLLMVPRWGSMAAAEGWHRRGLTKLAEADMGDEIASIINTGQRGRVANGMPDRRRRALKLKRLLGVGAPRPAPGAAPPEPGVEVLPDRSLAWPIPYSAVAELARTEKLTTVGRLTRGGVPVWGWGDTQAARQGARCTKEEADSMLLRDLTGLAQAVQALSTRPCTPNQLGALVVLAYSTGIDVFRKSTVLKAHNAADHVAAARAFGLLATTRDGESREVAARRLREAALYLQPEPGEHQDAVPQEIQPESSAVDSPIHKLAGTLVVGSAATAGKQAVESTGAAEQIGALGAFMGVVNGALDGVRAFVGALVPAEYQAPLLVAAIAGGVMYWRRKQRRKGFA